MTSPAMTALADRIAEIDDLHRRIRSQMHWRSDLGQDFYREVDEHWPTLRDAAMAGARAQMQAGCPVSAHVTNLREIVPTHYEHRWALSAHQIAEAADCLARLETELVAWRAKMPKLDELARLLGVCEGVCPLSAAIARLALLQRVDLNQINMINKKNQEIERLQAALLKRVQEDNACDAAPGCTAPGWDNPQCGCALEARAFLESLNAVLAAAEGDA